MSTSVCGLDIIKANNGGEGGGGGPPSKATMEPIFKAREHVQKKTPDFSEVTLQKISLKAKGRNDPFKKKKKKKRDARRKLIDLIQFPFFFTCLHAGSIKLLRPSLCHAGNRSTSG